MFRVFSAMLPSDWHLIVMLRGRMLAGQSMGEGF